MDTKAMTVPTVAADIERVLMTGDLSALTPDQRVSYYRAVCDTIGLNPLTRPFDYIKLNGKLVLYAKKEATDQIRDLKRITIDKPDIQFSDGLCIVSVTARDQRGRQDSDVGIVDMATLKGADKANAILKAVTKGKRRVTLSICGLGLMSEDEVQELPGARDVEVTDNGEVVNHRPQGEWTEEIDEGTIEQENAPLPDPGVTGPGIGLQNGHVTQPQPSAVRVPQELATLIKRNHGRTYQNGSRQGRQGLVVNKLDELAGDTVARHDFLKAIFGVQSIKDVTDADVMALDSYVTYPSAKSEIARVIADYLKLQGQQELAM